MNQPCFVTGGSGFIGQHLLALLTRQGHPVTVLMRQPLGLAALRAQVDQLGGQGGLLTGVVGDLGLPALGLDAAAREQIRQAAVVFHLGAQFAWGMAAEQARRVNVAGALAVAVAVGAVLAAIAVVKGCGGVEAGTAAVGVGVTAMGGAD